MPSAPALQPQDIPLDPGQLAILTSYLRREVGAAFSAHASRQKHLANLLRAYKAIPEVEKKNFPWPGASNVVVPVVAITVDTIAARLQRAMFGAKDPVEAHLNTKTPFVMTVPPDPNAPSSQAQPGAPPQMSAPQQVPLDDKLLRDWCASYLRQSGGRDRLRTIFTDMPLYGDAFASPLWVDDTKVYHAYDASGQVVEQEIPSYTGVRWNIPAPTDVFWPTGYDEWDQLPWFSIILRYSAAELAKFVQLKVFKKEDVDRLKARQRSDERRKVEKKSEKVEDMPNEIYELCEIRGVFAIPTPSGQSEAAEPEYEEVVLTYNIEHNILFRAIYNPYFGKARHFVKIPYLLQPHELPALGVAEMALQFQQEATTSHNQVIDAATAANGGITVVSNDTNFAPNEEIHPGKTLTTDGKAGEGLAVFHLGEASQQLGMVEEKAFFLNEKRTGVSVYNLGMESPTVGSRATATGTTALINEGNQRFWVSIDDMRSAIEELLYLTIQLEQQMRPEGYWFESGRYIQFPPGDPRQTIGLRLKLSSEAVNRDIEVQQMQMLMQVCNDYYMRLNQAMMLITNPQFPPQAKMMAMETMMASSVIVKKFVERFDVEDLDSVVPTVMSALQGMQGMMQMMMGGMGGPQQPPGQPPQGPPGPAIGAPDQAPQPAGGSRRPM